MSLNPPLTEWSGQLAWLVGASSGIGRATASALHAQGATVVVSARKAADLERYWAESARMIGGYVRAGVADRL